MNEHLQRAQVLLGQNRPDLAEEQLRMALAQSPDDAVAHACLASCLWRRRVLDEATEEARRAIAQAPMYAWAHYLLGGILAERNRLAEAEASAREALRLAPDAAGVYGMLGHIHLQQRNWAAALEIADQGLARNATDADCTNVRARALTLLGRNQEAAATIEGNLQRDPQNPQSHANLGWNYLHQGNHAKAMEHFREALRLNPELESARLGMIEALKARNPVYGVMLRYFLWMGRHSRTTQWAVIIGLFVLDEMLDSLAKAHPALAPYFHGIIIAYVVFAILTWLSGPLFNLMLRLNRFGRHLLTDDQRRGSTCTGLLLGATLACATAWLVTRQDLTLLGIFYFGLLTLPASAIFSCDRGWPRMVMAAYTLGLAAMPPVAIAIASWDKGMAQGLLEAFGWGAVLSLVVANVLRGALVKR